jgi:hypothetical protein
MPYKILRVFNDEIDTGHKTGVILEQLFSDLQRVVNEQEADGWQPVGGLSVLSRPRPNGTTHVFAQAMVKVDDSERKALQEKIAALEEAERVRIAGLQQKREQLKQQTKG